MPSSGGWGGIQRERRRGREYRDKQNRGKKSPKTSMYDVILCLRVKNVNTFCKMSLFYFRYAVRFFFYIYIKDLLFYFSKGLE